MERVFQTQGTAFEAQRTASTKALREEWAWYIQGIKEASGSRMQQVKGQQQETESLQGVYCAGIYML